jgi:hypothetical protein
VEHGEAVEPVVELLLADLEEAGPLRRSCRSATPAICRRGRCEEGRSLPRAT